MPILNPIIESFLICFYLSNIQSFVTRIYANIKTYYKKVSHEFIDFAAVIFVNRWFCGRGLFRYLRGVDRVVNRKI